MPAKTFGFVRSTQIFFTTMGMYIKNQTKLFMYTFFGVFLLSILFLSFFIKSESFTIFGQYYWVKTILALAADSLKAQQDLIHVTWNHQLLQTNYITFFESPWTISIVNGVWTDFILLAVLDLMIVLAIFSGLVWYFTAKGKALKEPKYIKGMRYATNQALVSELHAKKVAGPFFIPAIENGTKGLNIPFTDMFERLHLLVHGTTGSGKGQLLMHLLDQIEKMGDKVVIYDKGCTFLKHYFSKERGDIILNPFDDRCANWDMWLDAPNPHLIDNMAAALIPQHAGSADPFWVNAARVIFSSVAQVMKDLPDHERTVEKLLEILIIKKLDNLSDYLRNTDAATLSDEKIEKMAISIRSILVTYCRSLRYLIPVAQKHKEKNKFSIREWLTDKNNKGWLFITCREEEKDVLKPLISMWLDNGVSTMMSLPEDYKGRTWFFYDEVASLQKLPSLSTGLAEIRKFGGCMVIGMQSFSQLQSVYGKDEAQAIFSLLNTRLFFRSPDSDTAKLASTELGEQEVEEARESYSYGTSNIRDGITLGTQRTKKNVVDYSEVMTLGDLQLYLRLIGELPVTKLELQKNIDRPIRALPFVAHEVKQKSKVEEALEKADKSFSSKIDLVKIKAIIEEDHPNKAPAKPPLYEKSLDLELEDAKTAEAILSEENNILKGVEHIKEISF